MNQNDYDKLNNLKNYKNFLLNRLDECNKEIKDLEEICDHKYPDGNDATYSGLISLECHICSC